MLSSTNHSVLLYGIQYTQRILHLSVTEILSFLPILPKPSTSSFCWYCTAAFNSSSIAFIYLPSCSTCCHKCSINLSGNALTLTICCIVSVSSNYCLITLYLISCFKLYYRCTI